MAFNLSATTHYVNVNNAHPVVPYTSWATAATNIQDAITFSGFGDTVLVTNGTYQYGGSSNTGSNRVSVVNNVILQSVNGPALTVIKGYQVPGTTNGANAVRCVYLSNGGTLSGFTLTGGATQNFEYGGGVMCNSTNATITNCVIIGNAAYDGGGGAYYGTLVNCSLISNSVLDTGSGGGGGANNSVLINCLLTGNFAGYNGGGASGLSTLINCTVVSNVSASTIGGAAGTLLNCIVYYNLSYLTQADTGNIGNFTNCCISFSSSGPGANNFTNPPGFVDLAGGNLRLQVGSPCINAGNNSFIANSIDLDGNPRIVGGTVDIGAYENQNTSPVHYVSLISASPVSPFTNWSTAATNIQDAVAVAQTGEFVVASNGIYKSGGTIVYGAESNRVALTNAITLLGLYGSQSTAVVGGTHMRCVYVGSNAVLEGFSLVDGGTQNTGDTVKERSGGGAWCEASGTVSNCVFGGTNFPYANGGSPTDSNNGSAEGGGVYGGTLYNCLLADNTAIDGGGAAAANLFNCMVISNSSASGGGIYQGTASNCMFTGNSAANQYGGGAYQSTLYNCALANNSSMTGGGAWGGVLYNCTLSRNVSSSWGGGAFGSALYGCTIVSNTASMGGGVYQGTLYNSHIISNATSGYSGNGGGVYQGTLYNCAISGNSSSTGGGAYQGSLYNCTIVSNTAGQAGGAYFATLYNSIIYYNSATAASNYYNGTLLYCDTLPLPSGSGNIGNAPGLVNPAGGDYHLQASSPCINSGNNSYVNTNVDLDGNPRIAGGTVDIGAYEFQTPTSVLSYAWAQQYGLPTDGSADYADPDGDGMNNWQEWRAGTDPLDASSVLQMLSATNTSNPSGINVTWQSVGGINYFIQRSSDLSAQPAFSTVQTNIAGQTGTTSYTDTTATNNGPFYFRVGVQ